MPADIEHPSLSINGLAKLTKQKPGSVYKALQNFKAGLPDKYGFEYTWPLVSGRIPLRGMPTED